MIEAKIVADSINPQGDRLTTFVVTFPRIILAEFNTHRMFSRNSASSRAIPFKKMVESVENNPFIPIAWQQDHKGMQGTEYITNETGRGGDLARIEVGWQRAIECAIEQATWMNNYGLTKQLCNRLLEPFMWHTVIITSGKDGLDNFFKLRDHEDAEIHIQELAKRMKESMSNSTPKVLQAGEWHIPFGDKIIFEDTYAFDHEQNKSNNEDRIKIATARCARVSYTVVGEEGKEPNYANDIKLHDRLAESGHWSPFEHCARVMSNDEYEKNKGWCKNFKGFIQYRGLIS